MVAPPSSSEVVGASVVSETADSAAVPDDCKVNSRSTLNLHQLVDLLHKAQ